MRIKFDVTPTEFLIIKNILEEHLCDGCKAWVFGSRAKNKSLHGSDLDLALECKNKIDLKIISNIKIAFEDSRLPYEVDVIDINNIEQYFKNIIDKEKILFPIKVNYKIPKLRFSEFSGEWVEKDLNSIGKIITGSTPSTYKSEYYNGNKLFVSPADIQLNRYIKNTKTTLTDLGFAQGRKVNKNSVCFVCIGSTIGKVAQLSEDSLTNQQINCITSNKSNFDNFIYSLLELKSTRIKLLAGEQAVPQINKSDFSKLKFNFPLKDEQQKIANFLTTIDKRIEKLEEKKSLLENYKKGVMQKIFNQKIRFKDDDGNNYPDWEEKKLGDVLNSISTKNYQIKNSEILESGKYKVIDQGQINIAGYSNKEERLYKDGEVIIYGDHTTIVKYINFHFIVGADGTKILVSNDNNHLKYLFYNLCFKNISPEGYKRHFSILKTICLDIPSLQEQQKIANFLTTFDKKIENIQAQISESKTFKKGLLQQMFV